LRTMEIPHSHDLRAASRISRRARSRAKKYFGFRYIKAGQLHQPHYRLLDSNDQRFPPNSGLFLSQNKHGNDTPIEYFTPKRLYQEAQYWPRPPTYHRRHRDKLDKRGAITAYKSRMVMQSDTRRMLREVEGPRVAWEDDELERSYGEFGAGYTICAHLHECINMKRDDYKEAHMAEALASHNQCIARSLLDEAMKKRVTEQEKQLDIEGWSILDPPDTDLESDLESEDEAVEAHFQWTLIDSPESSKLPTAFEWNFR
ncbi:MAG: hypothetical protein Q9184_006376, partial [Pyrenodesmia sp. 2 TL-2023]